MIYLSFYINDKDSEWAHDTFGEKFNNIPIAGFYLNLFSYTRNEIITSCSDNDSVESVHMCTYLIMNDGWEIKDDYPIKI